MSECIGHTHEDHDHDHGPDCGHTAIKLGDDIAYLHDGHLHVIHGDHVHCRSIEFSAENPDGCCEVNDCGDHVHGPDCGHEPVPHGDHIDYIVNGRLHHPHDGHCDDHGPVKILDK